MPGDAMAAVKIGDVFEAKTEAGFIYFQYTHKSKDYVNLLYAFEEIYRERPVDVCDIVKGKTAFYFFTTISIGLRKKVVTLAGNCEVPRLHRSMPTFRGNFLNDPLIRKSTKWNIWRNGEWIAQEKSEDLLKYPVLCAWPIELAIERVVDGWRPETSGE